MNVSEYINRARRALDEEELGLAHQYFTQVLNRYPHNEEALQGLKDIAVKRAQKASFLAKGYKLFKGNLLRYMGKAEQAYNDLEVVYRSQPNKISTALMFARCATKAGNLENAHEAYQSVLEENATHPKALEEDAEILIKLDRYEEAAELLQRLQALKPDDDKVTHRLRDVSAQAYSRTGIPENLKEKRAAVEKKKREAPGTPEFMKQLEEMQEEYNKNKKNIQLGVDIAAHHRRGGLYDEANRILGPILDSNPDFDPARREQARVWKASGDLEIAENLYKELHSKTPDDLELKVEYLDASIANLEAKVNVGETARESFNQLERLKLDRDKTKMKLMQNILENHPEADKERAELGELLINHGRVDEAIPVLQRLLREPSWAGRGFFLLGQAFRAQHDLNLAVEQYEKSLEFFKNRGYSHIPSEELKAVYYYLGLTYAELGNKEKARQAFGNIYSVDINYKDVKEQYEKTYS